MFKAKPKLFQEQDKYDRLEQKQQTLERESSTLARALETARSDLSASETARKDLKRVAREKTQKIHSMQAEVDEERRKADSKGEVIGEGGHELAGDYSLKTNLYGEEIQRISF